MMYREIEKNKMRMTKKEALKLKCWFVFSFDLVGKGWENCELVGVYPYSLKKMDEIPDYHCIVDLKAGFNKLYNAYDNTMMNFNSGYELCDFITKKKWLKLLKQSNPEIIISDNIDDKEIYLLVDKKGNKVYESREVANFNIKKTTKDIIKGTMNEFIKQGYIKKKKGI